jgi:diguanylate cyclase (GGDEF)-like protein
LLSAKIAVLENESLDTISQLFKKALDAIGKNDFIHMKALCNELYAFFWFERGDDIIAKAYIREAYYLYRQWGALSKVALMEKKFEQHFISTENTLQGTAKTTSMTTVNSIDINSILKSAQAITSEIKIEKLLTILINIIIENACAQRGCILLKNETDGQFYVEAGKSLETGDIRILSPLHFMKSEKLCVEIIQYVARTRETLVLHNAVTDPSWRDNSYIVKNNVKSVLCLPIFYQNRLKGIVYLENNLSDSVFTIERLETLKILSSQAAISIENARLYENMEEKVRDRTLQLNDANEKLKELSIRDPMTGLHNRRYVFEFAYENITRHIQNKAETIANEQKGETDEQTKSFGVFLLDIDFFKAVNDTYGHSAGDNVLITLSKVLKKMIKRDDLLVRWGGEEFLLILHDRKAEELKSFSKKVLKTIRQTPFYVGENLTVFKTASLGYVEMPFDYTTPTLLNLEQMINISDFALYCAKENGRNCAAHFKLLKPVGDNEALKMHLINLSKSSILNEEYFEVEFV